MYCSSRRDSGFTLIEVLVVVLIIGVLVAVAFPTYQDSVRKGRRSEAIAALATLQQAQERWRANRPAYGNLNATPDANTLTGVSGTTANSYYQLTVDNPTATGYEAKATAQGSQASDTACALIGVRMTGGTVSYGSGTSALNWSDPGRCWAK